MINTERFVAAAVLSALSIIVALAWRDALSHIIRGTIKRARCNGDAECERKVTAEALIVDATLTTIVVLVILFILYKTRIIGDDTST